MASSKMELPVHVSIKHLLNTPICGEQNVTGIEPVVPVDVDKILAEICRLIVVVRQTGRPKYYLFNTYIQVKYAFCPECLRKVSELCRGYDEKDLVLAMMGAEAEMGEADE